MFTLEGWTQRKSGLLLPTEPIVLTLPGIRFAHFCRKAMVHTKGQWAKTPLSLEPWQIAMFSEMLRTEPCNTFLIEPEQIADPWLLFEEIIERPWFEIEVGSRVYREAYVQMPEKTGKSTIMSALELYGLAWDGEDGAEVYVGATTADQARIIFSQAQQSIKRSAFLQTLVRKNILSVYKDAIHHVPSDSVFRVLSSDDAHNEGLNPHFICIDELWAHPTRALYDTLTSRIHSGTRRDPLAISITNAGDDSESICYEVYLQGKAVLAGREDARTDLFAFIPELTPAEEDDPPSWKKVNPQSYMTVELLAQAKAKQPPFVFKRRRLNVWTDTAEAWLDPQQWDACEETPLLDPEEGDIIFLGIDLGLKRDTAAVTAAGFNDAGRLEVFSQVWGLINEKGEYPPCHVEIDDTRLSISLVENYILDLAMMGWQIGGIAYDPYRMERTAQTLADTFLVVEFPQTDTRMVPASEDLFVDVRDMLLAHDGDEVLRKHVMAGVAQETGRGWRIAKRLAKRPVDALTALAMACSMAREEIAVDAPSFEML